MPQAIVTGATSGIGRAIALALRDTGHEVVALGRDEVALASLAAETGIRPVRVELTDRAALGRVLEGFAPDILINNAGVMPPVAHFCDMSEAEIERAIAVNLSAALTVTRLIAPGMRERQRGHIFFTGSTAGHAPFANLAVYCASKAAISGFSQALRLDMAPHRVRVTEIVAGRVETSLYNERLPVDVRAAMYAGQTAVQPSDVAAMVVAILALPQYVNVARFDIEPTHQASATGAQKNAK